MLYNIVAEIATLILRLLPFKCKKLKDTVDGRKKLIEKVKQTIDSNAEIAWFHCASLGEFEQARELIERFKHEFPKYKILLTFFSSSGYNVRKNYANADYVFYIPFDTAHATKQFVKAINPKIVVFIKYEFWRNIINAIKDSGAKLYIVSVIFNPNKPFFKWWGGMFRNVLKRFDYIFVQNTQSAELLKSIGITNCSIAGDTRFDRVFNIVKKHKTIEKIEQFCAGEKVFISGSSWEKDDEITMELILDNPQLKFIIAPHELGEKKIETLYNNLISKGIGTVRYTKNRILGKEQVLILDTIGILSHVYKHGRLAYIGGGFGAGIHNTLEAATFGLPMVFGPNNKPFKEAQDLLMLQVATEINSSKDAKKWLKEILSNSNREKELSEKSKHYIEENKGACDLIIKYLHDEINELNKNE